MNKKIIALVGAFVALGSFCVGAVASNGLQQITAWLNPEITVEYNGENQVMNDANGNRVYPVSYNDTTYLPIRAVSDMLGVHVEWDGEAQRVVLRNSYPGTGGTGGTEPVRTSEKMIISATNMDEFHPVQYTITAVRHGDEAKKLLEQYKSNTHLDASSIIKNDFEPVIIEYECTIPSNLVNVAKYYDCEPSTDLDFIVIDGTRYFDITRERDMYGKNTQEVMESNKRYGVTIFTVPQGYKDWEITFDGAGVCENTVISGSEFY